MTDLLVTRDSELMVAQVEGTTDEGTDFVDGFNPVGVGFVVVDSGRIVVDEGVLPALREGAKQRGLTVAEEVVA